MIRITLSLLLSAATLPADLISQKVMESLIKKDYPAMSYQKHCLSCHGPHGRGVEGHPIGQKELANYPTLSEILRRTQKAHRDLPQAKKADLISLIYALRYARDRLR